MADPVTTMTILMASSAASVLTRILRERKESEDKTVVIKRLPPDNIDELLGQASDVEKVAESWLSLTRGASKTDEPLTPTAQMEIRAVGGTALALDPDAVLNDARRRIDFMFRISMGMAITMAVLLFFAVGASIVAGLFGRTVWAAVFGGAAVVDVIGALVYKPLDAVSNATVNAQRLDILHLSMRERLSDCNAHEDLNKRIECTTAVWDDVQAMLASLSPTPA